jgi:hypothetical protein
VINISNPNSKNNPSWLLAEPARPAWPALVQAQDEAAATPAQAGSCSRRARITSTVVTLGRVLLSWLAAVPRRLGDRLFAMNDTEAYWHDWQIIKTRGGLARRYRDLRFDTLAECPRCRGAGVTANLPCGPCLGTGRITLGEVSGTPRTRRTRPGHT